MIELLVDYLELCECWEVTQGCVRYVWGAKEERLQFSDLLSSPSLKMIIVDSIDGTLKYTHTDTIHSLR